MNGFEPRPRGMHLTTFTKLALEYANVSKEAFEYLAAGWTLSKSLLPAASRAGALQ